MRRLMLWLMLIASSSSCSHLRGPASPPPPAMERCLMLSTGLECRAIDGHKYADPYPGKEPRLCIPLPDWEARQDWERAVRR